jgi:hypothetical protein
MLTYLLVSLHHIHISMYSVCNLTGVDCKDKL